MSSRFRYITEVAWHLTASWIARAIPIRRIRRGAMFSAYEWKEGNHTGSESESRSCEHYECYIRKPFWTLRPNTELFLFTLWLMFIAGYDSKTSKLMQKKLTTIYVQYFQWISRVLFLYPGCNIVRFSENVNISPLAPIISDWWCFNSSITLSGPTVSIFSGTAATCFCRHRWCKLSSRRLANSCWLKSLISWRRRRQWHINC